MLWLWRYIMGYLTIKIQGENVEQLLNRAASNGIKIWNLIYKNGSILVGVPGRTLCAREPTKDHLDFTFLLLD